MKEILIALITGGALTKMIDWGRVWWTENKSKKTSFSRLIPRLHKVYEILQIIIRESAVNRAVILKLENGGGIPKLGSTLYSSVVFESCKLPLTTIKEHWQKQRIDEAYVRMMVKLNKAGELEILADDLEDGILKTLYQAAGIKKARIYKIAEKENRYIYASLNYSNLHDDSANALDIIRFSINELRRLFEKNDL